MFEKEIILDQEAFSTAAKEFEELSVKLKDLRGEVMEMMTLLEKGFDTPAGRQFIQSCKKNLYDPLNDQKLVLAHISDTLTDVRKKYDPVFTEYEALVSEINKVQNGE